jgi:hypothetical protein
MLIWANERNKMYNNCKTQNTLNTMFHEDFSTLVLGGSSTTTTFPYQFPELHFIALDVTSVLYPISRSLANSVAEFLFSEFSNNSPF